MTEYCTKCVCVENIALYLSKWNRMLCIIYIQSVRIQGWCHCRLQKSHTHFHFLKKSSGVVRQVFLSGNNVLFFMHFHTYLKANEYFIWMYILFILNTVKPQVCICTSNHCVLNIYIVHAANYIVFISRFCKCHTYNIGPFFGTCFEAKMVSEKVHSLKEQTVLCSESQMVILRASVTPDPVPFF